VRAIRQIVLVLGGCAVPLLAAQAQSLFEKLVIPGEVIEGHAKLEKDCGQCHEPFDKKSQRRLCLACHKDVARDIESKVGFHGRRREVAGVECKHCHTEHKGRSFDIVKLDRQTFNHDLTDFKLDGRHRTASCSVCHVAPAKFRAAPGECIGCHKQDDHHKGTLGRECAGCHAPEGWRKTKPFDHGKTKFPLEGAHQKVACAVCHVGERYKDLPRLCVDCHRIQDRHRGRYGDKCERCHNAKDWKSVGFDHDKTKFPLRGNHKAVKCDACHSGDLYADKLATGCASCHGRSDPHKGQLGTRCERCHAETGWRKKVDFDHDITRFPLIGLHSGVACEECHRNQAYKSTPSICSGCHKDGHHEGRLGPECSRCHNPNGWKLWRFDHDRQTRFPLDGAHAGLDCHACHKSRVTAKASAPSSCHGCHASDDAHQGAFGRACEKCHTTQSFRQTRPRP
jgi:hypothetical protein